MTDPRDLALAWSDSDAGVKRCHACWGWFPTEEYTKSDVSRTVAALMPSVVASGHLAICDGVCRVPLCETHEGRKES